MLRNIKIQKMFYREIYTEFNLPKKTRHKFHREFAFFIKALRKCCSNIMKILYYIKNALKSNALILQTIFIEK